MEISNQYCPEHLIINTKDNLYTKDLVENAGSVFLDNMPANLSATTLVGQITYY